jgi:hypothetical protein
MDDLCLVGTTCLHITGCTMQITPRQKPSMEEKLVLEWLDPFFFGDFLRHANSQLYQADNI